MAIALGSGLLIAAVPAALALASATPSPGTVALMAVAGVGNVVGLLAEFQALRSGRVSVVVPIVSAEGAVAAAITAVAGEPVAALTWLVLTAIVVGVVVVGTGEGPGDDAGAVRAATAAPWVTVALSIVAAASFGAGIYAQGRIGAELPLGLAVLAAPLAGFLLLVVPRGMSGALRLRPWRPVLLAIGVGVVEIVGIALYTIGARETIAVTAVLSSQFAAVSVLLAFVLFGERMRRRQTAGLVVIALGVAVLPLVH